MEVEKDDDEYGGMKNLTRMTMSSRRTLTMCLPLSLLLLLLLLVDDEDNCHGHEAWWMHDVAG